MASELNKNYAAILQDLKEKIRKARLKAAFTVNTQLLQLYWQIGTTILLQQQKEGWGTKIISRLAADLKSEFPDMKGLSERNIVYMQTFATAWPDFLITQQPVAKLTKRKKKNTITQALLAKLPAASITQAPLAKSIQDESELKMPTHSPPTPADEYQSSLVQHFSNISLLNKTAVVRFITNSF